MQSFQNLNRNSYSIYAAFVMWCIICASCNFKPAPSDDVLLEDYQKNKSGYTDLVKIFSLNPYLRDVSAQSLNPDDSETLGILKSEILEFRQLCEQLEVPLLIKRGYNEILIIKYDRHPFPPGGTYKGYAVLTEPPLDLVPDLDTYWEGLKNGESIKSFTVYRQINKKWYLFLDYED